MKLLYELGANIDTPDRNDCTLIQIAEYRYQENVVYYLAELGADNETTDWVSIAVKSVNI